jgi:hypothetical protein
VDERCQLPLIFTSFICGNVVIALSKRVGSVINPNRANPFRIGRTDRGTLRRHAETHDSSEIPQPRNSPLNRMFP